MRFLVWLLFVIAIPSISWAGSPSPTTDPLVSVGSFNNDAYRTYRICIAGDIQNMIQKLTIANSYFNGETCAMDTSRNCSGEYCNKGLFCNKNWNETQLQLVKNMAYSMAGRWDLIDYNGINGWHNIKTTWPNNLYHEKCDLVLFPGDLQQSGDASSNPPSASDIFEWERVKVLLNILEENDVEWMTTLGNHDSTIKYSAEIGARMAANPHLYASSGTGLSHALLLPTRMNKYLCVLGVVDTASGETYDSAFFATNSGCGADYATIAMGHWTVEEEDCVLMAADMGADIDNLGHEEVFLAIAGHETPSVNIELCKAKTNPAAWAGGEDLFIVNSNTQELGREYTSSAALPYGSTPADNCGGLYTYIELDPANSRIHMSDWNPYYQSSGNQRVSEESSCGYIPKTLNSTFDFDTRYVADGGGSGGGVNLALNCVIDPAYRTGTTLTAPAYVHINCIGTTHTDGDVRPFHDLRYVIDYNDDACASGTGAWANSDTGALKNRDVSPVGGHVYECAGTYTMDVSVCDSAGDCDTWTSASFTVQSEDAGWPGTATKCVAAVLPVAGVDGCPAGAAVQASTDYDASLQLSAGSRTLFRCGETFVASADVTTSDASANGSLIGSYGTQPCKATVSKTYSGVLHYSLTSNARFGGWRVRDLIYDAATTSANDGFWIGKDGASGLNHPNVLWLRMEALHVGICPTNGNTPNTVATNELYAMVGNYCLRDVPASYTWSMWEYASLQRGLIVDNFWEGLDGPSGQRIYARSYNLFAHNRLKVSGAASVLVQSWRGHYGDLDVDTEYLVIQDNRYEDDSTETGRTVLLTVACGSTCNPPGPPGPEDGHDILFEGNRFAYANTQGRDSIHTPIMTLKRDTTIRNNIIDWRAFPGAVSGVQIVSSYSDGGSTYAPAGLRTYNNTLIRSGTTSMNAFACVASGGGSDTCRNNLVYDVTDTDTSLTSGSFALTPSNNVHLNGASCPFYGASGACELTGVCAAGIGVDFDCFKLRASGGGIGSVKDQGFTFPETASGYADTVYADAFGGCRGGSTGGPDALWDIGAHEYGASGC